MLHTFYRQDLFDLVWSEPTRTIAKRLGISDVGLAKACRRADLLLPPRGYWAKLAAGKTVKKPQLPRRGPGMPDRIVLGGTVGAGTRSRRPLNPRSAAADVPRNA